MWEDIFDFDITREEFHDGEYKPDGVEMSDIKLEFTISIPIDDGECLCEDCQGAERMSWEAQIGQDKIGRNERRPCGSGRKYKNCCLGK